MVYLKLLDVNLPENAEHIATDWYLFDDISGTEEHLITKSANDTENLKAKTFNVDIISGNEYYARARVIYKYKLKENGEEKDVIGYTLPSDLTVTTAFDNDDVVTEYDTPSIITTPMLETVFDKNNHPASMFYVTGSKYSACGNSKHKSTTWIIENSKGEVVFIDNDNKIEKDKKLIDINLLPNDIYTIKAIYKGTNNDISQMGSVSLLVKNKKYINILNKNLIRDKNNASYLEIELYITNYNLSYELYENNKLIKTLNTNETELYFDKELFKDNNFYTVSVKLRDNNDKLIETDYVSFFLNLNETNRFPISFPYIFRKDKSRSHYFPLMFPHIFIDKLK